MDNIKLRLKIGQHEFEAEGPELSIQTHLNEFKNLICNQTVTETPKTYPHTADTQNPASLTFNANPTQKSITLRFLPPADQGPLKQTADALLMTLFGYKDAIGEAKVTVIKAAGTIRNSGLVKTRRLSNAFLLLEKNGFALKTGSGKGTCYQISEKGQIAAQELIYHTLRKAGI